jgi:hypothetical protein
MKNPRETRTCIARAARRGSTSTGSPRCGAEALDYGDVRVAGQLVEIPLCQTHFRKLRDSSDPIALGASWALDAPAA